jgi:hypothetical protein
MGVEEAGLREKFPETLEDELGMPTKAEAAASRPRSG